MKKISKLLIMCMATCSLVLTSCDKEDEFGDLGNKFIGTIDRESKTHLDGLNVKWNEGDQIAIFKNGVSTSGIYEVDQILNGGSSATFYYHSGTEHEITEDGVFRAVYPSSMATANNSRITIPSEQRYSASTANNIDFPMYGYGTGTTLNFNNVCGILRLHLTRPGGGGKITRIVVTNTNSRKLNGMFDVRQNNGKYGISTSSTNTASEKSITITFGTNGRQLAEENDFYIYLPAGTYSGLKITAFGINPGCNGEIQLLGTQATSGNNITFARNEIRKITRNIAKIPSGGLFSISNTHKVYIAPGNLHNSTGINNGDYSNSWDFYDDPYNFIGTVASTTNGRGEWNRFSYSTTATNCNYGMYMESLQYPPNEQFVDWGNNVIDGDPANTWFTLSEAEWRYLLDGRVRAGKMTGGATTAYGSAYIIPREGLTVLARKDVGSDLNRINRAFFIPNGMRSSIVNLTVNNITRSVVNSGKTISGYGNDLFAGIPCIVIYPDNFPANKQLDLQCEFYCNGYNGNNQNNINNKPYALTDARVAELVSLGCAILPLSGQGQGASSDSYVKDVLTHGYYWTSTNMNNCGETRCLKLIRQNTNIGFQIESDTRGNGNAVRLMQPANFLLSQR